MIARLPRWLAPVLLLAVLPLLRAEPLPPAPAAYFNDYAGVVRRDTAQTLDARLARFDRDTTNQLVVAIFPRLESASSIEDYTVRVAQSWRVGQKGKNNGAVLFVFVASHQLYIQVGYGLEGALPDATCKTIIDRDIKPRFRAGDYAGGLDAAITSMIAATRGEYQAARRSGDDDTPPPRYVPSRARGDDSFTRASHLLLFLVILFAIFIHTMIRWTGGGRSYGRSSNNSWWDGGGGGGGSWGGGSSSGGGGGFSGGGGSFGGGGSGGSW